MPPVGFNFPLLVERIPSFADGNVVLNFCDLLLVESPFARAGTSPDGDASRNRPCVLCTEANAELPYVCPRLKAYAGMSLLSDAIMSNGLKNLRSRTDPPRGAWQRRRLMEWSALYERLMRDNFAGRHFRKCWIAPNAISNLMRTAGGTQISITL